MKKKPAKKSRGPNGGKRPGAGRKPLFPGEPVEMVYLTLPVRLLEKLDGQADNRSVVVARLIEKSK